MLTNFFKGDFVKYAKLFVPVVMLYAGSAAASHFESLYELGKKNNLLLKAQGALQESSKQQEKLSFSRLLPSAALLGNWNYQKEKSQFQSDNFLQTIPDRRTQADGLGYEVTITQSLFNLPAYYNYRRGLEVSARADLLKTQAQFDYMQEFSQTYLNLVADHLRLGNIDDTVKAYQAQRDLIAKQYETGFVKPSDLQQAEASLATLRSEAIVVQSRLTVSFKRIELLLQSEVASIPGIIDNLDRLTAFDKTLKDSLFKYKDNIDYRVASANVEIADQELKASSNVSMPSVAASVRYRDNHFDNTADFQPGTEVYQDGLSFAIQVRVPLYSGSGESYTKQASAYNYESAKFQKQFAQHQTQQAIRSTFLSIKAGIETVKSRQHSVLASESALANANTEYRAGIGQYTDVRNSQDRLFDETNRLILEKINLIANYFALARLTGEAPDTTVNNIKNIFTGEVISNES